MIKNKQIQNLVEKYYENKFSHIFLIETNDKTATLNDILELIKIINCPNKFKDDCSECNLCHLISKNSIPSLSIIYPDGQAIKKAQMEELKLLFAHKPYLSKYNVYIINDAEKFNSFSANTMLKFIEEPESNIIGFLITNNKENVISTIKSRCELVKAIYETNNQSIMDQKIKSLALNYLKNIEIVKKNSIITNKEIIDEKLDKNQLEQLFQFILEFYLNILNKKEINEEFKILYSESVSEILRRIKLVSDVLDKLNYNVNINLLLDYFVLSLEG